MKRLLWLGVGLAVGALVVRAVSRRAQAYSPAGIAASVRESGRNTLDTVRDFIDDVRDGMHQREQELHAAFEEGRPLDAELDPDLADLDPDLAADPDLEAEAAVAAGFAEDLAAARGSRLEGDPTRDPTEDRNR